MDYTVSLSTITCPRSRMFFGGDILFEGSDAVPRNHNKDMKEMLPWRLMFEARMLASKDNLLLI